MPQHSNRHRLEPESLLMTYLPRWYDYPPGGPWLAVPLQVDFVPRNDSIGRSEQGMGTEAVIGAIDPARILVDRPAAPHMFASAVIGSFSMLALGLA